MAPQLESSGCQNQQAQPDVASAIAVAFSNQVARWTREDLGASKTLVKMSALSTCLGGVVLSADHEGVVQVQLRLVSASALELSKLFGSQGAEPLGAGVGAEPARFFACCIRC